MAQTQTITMGRGETFELIAKRYGMTVEELKQMNPNAMDGIVGMTLTVKKQLQVSAESTPMSGRTKRADKSADEWREVDLIWEAEDLINSKKYSKAIKKYNKLIKINPSATYYMMRGACYDMENKYKSAIADYQTALNKKSLPDDYKEECQQLLADAEKKRKQQIEKRNRTWGAIGAAVALTAATTATVYAASEQSKSSSFASYHSNSYSTTKSGTMSPNQFMQQMSADIERSAAQMKARTNQYMNDHMAWRDQFKAANGRDPYEYEEDQWLSQHYPDMLQAKYAAASNTSSMSNANNGSDRTKKEQQDSEHNNKTETLKEKNMQYWIDYSNKDCSICRGTGICQTCNGDGWAASISRGKYLCPVCFNHDGKCTSCGGDGKINK